MSIAVIIVYRNHRGEVGVRRICPHTFYLGSTEWHPQTQWLLEAFDLSEMAKRTFAMNDILSWVQEDLVQAGQPPIGQDLHEACLARWADDGGPAA